MLQPQYFECESSCGKWWVEMKKNRWFQIIILKPEYPFKPQNWDLYVLNIAHEAINILHMWSVFISYIFVTQWKTHIFWGPDQMLFCARSPLFSIVFHATSDLQTVWDMIVLVAFFVVSLLWNSSVLFCLISFDHGGGHTEYDENCCK